MQRNSQFLLGTLLGILGLGFFIYKSQANAPLAIVDMQRLLNQPAVMLSQSKFPETTQKKLLKRYTAILPKVLKAYGASHHVTLITATVISQGHLDVTDEVISMTLERLNAS